MEQKIDELEETCKLKESCIASLKQREVEYKCIIILLRKELYDEAQAAITELFSKHAKVDQSQCSAQIEALEQQLEKPNALVAASDVAVVGINVGEYSNKHVVTAHETESEVEIEMCLIFSRTVTR